jgi:hypothetical protein
VQDPLVHEVPQNGRRGRQVDAHLVRSLHR